MTDLDPKCLKKEPSPGNAFALTNKGELIPCCWLDSHAGRTTDKEYQKLLSVSKVSDYENIEDIFLTEEWQLFLQNLYKGKGFKECHLKCKAGDIHIREVVENG